MVVSFAVFLAYGVSRSVWHRALGDVGRGWLVSGRVVFWARGQTAIGVRKQNGIDEGGAHHRSGGETSSGAGERGDPW